MTIEPCTSIEAAAHDMVMAVVKNKGMMVRAEFNGIILVATLNTSEDHIVRSYYTQRRDRARAEALAAVENERRAGLFPALLEAVKNLYGDHGQINHEIEALIERCENLEAKTDEDAHDKF